MHQQEPLLPRLLSLGKFQLFLSAHIITLDDDSLARADREYVDSFSQSKPSSSYVLASDPSEADLNLLGSESDDTSSSENSQINKEVFVIDARSSGALSVHAKSYLSPNRNQRQRVHFEKKEKAVEKPSEFAVPRKTKRSRRSREPKTSASSSLRAEVEANQGLWNLQERSEVTGSFDCSKPEEPRIIVVQKGRALPEGLASLGAKALHIKAWISSLNEW